jgi:cobalt-zinc-cadmium efflux system protein
MTKHEHSHSHHLHNHGSENIRVAFFLNLIFTVIEIIGGIYTNSLAILADAVHDLGDSLSLGLSWYFQNVAKKDRDKKYSYGYGRFSLLGAIINSFVLLIGSFYMIKEAIPRLFNPEAVDETGMMVLAVLGIIVNGAAVIKLKRGNSINEKVVSLHLMEDVLGWVAVLIGSIIMYFFDIPIIDPLLSLAISGYVLFNIYSNIKEIFKIILQAYPNNVDIGAIKKAILSNEDIENIHNVHIWSLDGEYNVMSLHVTIEYDLKLSEINKIKKKIKHILVIENIHHFTIEFEHESENCKLDKH